MNQQILWWEPTVIVRRLVIIRLPWIEHQVERDCFPRVTTAVKRNACANEVVLASRALVSRAKFEREVEELDVVTRNLRNNLQKEGKMGKRNLETCRKQNAGILFTYHFLLNFIKKVTRSLNIVIFWLVWMYITPMKPLGCDKLEARCTTVF